MSSPKCRSVEVINNPAKPGSKHKDMNYINYKQQMKMSWRELLRCDIDVGINQR